MTGKASVKERQYWDANIIIGIISGEGSVSICNQILVAAERGEVEIVTSTLTIAEVTGGSTSASNEEVHEQIDVFFQQPFVYLVAVDRTIAKRAQQLRIDRYKRGARGLPGNDAIHLATALDSNVDVMFSLDKDDLLRLSGEYATKIGTLLTITEPRWSYQSDFLTATEEPSELEGGEGGSTSR